MNAKPPTIDESHIEISKFFKNRWRRAVIVISISHYEGNDIINIREHFTDAAGCMRPSTKGLAMGIRKLPELARALAKAEAEARLRGLIPKERGSE